MEHKSKVVIGSTKRYFNCIDKIIKLNYGELYLLLYLSEISDSECEVRSDRKLRDDFRKFIRIVSSDTLNYTDSTVKDQLKSLKKIDFLVDSGRRGVLWLNPKYFYSGNDNKRLSMIKYVERNMVKKEPIIEAVC